MAENEADELGQAPSGSSLQIPEVDVVAEQDVELVGAVDDLSSPVRSASESDADAPFEDEPLATEVWTAALDDFFGVVVRKRQRVDAKESEATKRQPLLEDGGPASEEEEEVEAAEEVDMPQKEGHGSVGSSVFNLMNTMIGGGAVTLPFAFRCTSIVPGLILLIVVAGLAGFSIKLLLVGSTLSKALSYDGIGRAAFPRHGHFIVQSVEILNTVGILSSYFGIIADQCVDLIRAVYNGPDLWYTSRFFLLIAVVVVLVGPLSLLKKINSLRLPSLLSLLFLFYMGILVVIRGLLATTGNDPNVTPCQPKWFSLSFNVFQAIPIMALGFTCHINLMHVFRELKTRTDLRMLKASNISIGVCFLYYASLGLLGCLQFCGDTHGDILRSYGLSNAAVIVARFGMLFSFALTYPILLFPCRNAVDSLLFHGKVRTSKRHFFETIAILVVTLLIAVFVKGVKDIFSLVGALTATALTFILPATFSLALVPGKWYKHPLKVQAAVLLGLGVIVGITGTVIVISNWGQT